MIHVFVRYEGENEVRKKKSGCLDENELCDCRLECLCDRLFVWYGFA